MKRFKLGYLFLVPIIIWLLVTILDWSNDGCVAFRQKGQRIVACGFEAYLLTGAIFGFLLCVGYFIHRHYKKS